MSNSASFISPFSSSSSQHGGDIQPQPHQHLIQFHLHLQQPGPSQTLQFSTEQVVQKCGPDVEQNKSLGRLAESTPAAKLGSVSHSKDLTPSPSTTTNSATTLPSTVSAPCQQTLGKKQKRRERRTNWKDAETFLLLESWRRHYKNLMDGSSYNEKRRIWGEIYDNFIQMCDECNIEKSDWEYEQVRKRIKNLQYEFKVLQPKVEDTDPERAASLRRGFPYYDALERITDVNTAEDKPLKEVSYLLSNSLKSDKSAVDVNVIRPLNAPVVPQTPPSPRNSSASPVTHDSNSQQGELTTCTTFANGSPEYQDNSANNPFGSPYTVIAAPPKEPSHEFAPRPQKEDGGETAIVIKQEKPDDDTLEKDDLSVQLKKRRIEATAQEDETSFEENYYALDQPTIRGRQESSSEIEGSNNDLVSVLKELKDMWKEALKRQQEQHEEIIQAQREQTNTLLTGLKDIFQDMLKQ